MFLEVNPFGGGGGVIASCVSHAKYRSFSFCRSNDCLVASLEPVLVSPVLPEGCVTCFDWLARPRRKLA